MLVNKPIKFIGPLFKSHRKLSLVWILLLLSLSIILPFSGCIEQFMPQLSAYEEVLVVDASIIRGDSIQKVVLSKSTDVFEPDFNPMTGCDVYVTDQDGNEFIFEESGRKGTYLSAIPQSYLSFGSVFQLHITTPEGKEYSSATETILESSPIDSIYHILEPHQTSATAFDNGLQFYADLKAPDSATKNYLWKVEETWEIYTEYNIDGQWKTTSISLPRYKPIEGLSHCWSIEPVLANYTASTQNLVVNEKKRIPLNFVPGTSSKLDVRYSVLVKQFTLNDEAYIYHNQNNFATSGDEGLYQKQPAQSKCNIKNLDDPNEVVLGYFWASSYTQKRLFFEGPLTTPQQDCEDLTLCIPPKHQSLMQYFQGLGRDLYLVAMEFANAPADSVTLWAFPPDQMCIDCTTDGATTRKPDYW